MTIQDDFEAGAREYAKHLEDREARERRDALALEARDQGNASAFAEFFHAALNQSSDTTDTQEIR